MSLALGPSLFHLANPLCGRFAPLSRSFRPQSQPLAGAAASSLPCDDGDSDLHPLAACLAPFGGQMFDGVAFGLGSWGTWMWHERTSRPCP